MTTYLAPVEKPRSLPLRIVFFFTRRRFGKVLTPLTVFGARMPLAFGSFYGKVAKLDKKLELPAATAMLVRQRVSNVNTCHFCIDIARWFAAREHPELMERLEALDDYRTSPLYSEAERAALDYATELAGAKEVSRETFERLARHYGEREICDIVWLVASEHLYNITNVGLNIGSDGLCEVPKGREPVAAASG
jgi:alkylhydroperoxidase family enzyme